MKWALLTDHSEAVLLLWFTISVIVYLCMYVLVNVLFWIAVWPFFGKKMSLWLSACSVLIVVPLL